MKKLKAVFLICIILLLSVICPTGVFAEVSEKNFSITDFHSDITYSVTASDDGIVIDSKGFFTLLPVNEPVLSCSVSNGVIYILSYTENQGTHNAAYYSFDTTNSNLAYFLTDLPVTVDENRFAVDSSNNLYLVDRYNNNTVNRYMSDKFESFSLNATVEQLLCLDGENVTAITTKGIFLIDSTQTVKVSSITPATPCIYKGSSVIEDRIGNLFTYNKGDLIPVEPETAPAEITLPSTDNNCSIVIKNSYLFIEQGTTVAKLYQGLGISNEDLTVYKTNSAVLSQGKLGTGMKASFDGKTYTVIIYGELTGEGNINSRDLKLLMKHLTGEKILNKTQELSADINKDGKLCTKDLLLLSKMY